MKVISEFSVRLGIQVVIIASIYEMFAEIHFSF